jgi:hypothetical protein
MDRGGDFTVMTVNNTTSVEITADVHLGDIGWTLMLAYENTGSARFTLKPTTTDTVPQLLDVANALYMRFTNEQKPLFDTKFLPKIGLPRLDFSYGSSDPEVSAIIFETMVDVKPKDGENRPLISELDFLFARLEPKKNGGQSRYLAGIRSQGSLSLVSPDAGVVGQLLGEVSLERLGFYYASHDIAAFPADQADQKNKRRHFASGLSVSLSLKLRGSQYDISFPSADLGLSTPEANSATTVRADQTIQPAEPKSEPAAPLQLQQKNGEKGRIWKDLNKTLGPLQLRRIGGEWKDDKLGLLLDATIELMGLSLELAGLALRVNPSKLSDFHFPQDLELGLDGLALAFERGPVSISGALLKTIEKTSKGDRICYAGQAAIRAATFSIGAMGGYSTTADNQPSFFIYGAFTGMLAGPPCFVVLGIAAGFGYNRAIVLPDIDKVREFSLVSMVLGPPAEPSSSSLLEQLGKSNQFPAVSGQYWIAAGIKFTSFKLIEAFALLTVQFGTRFEIALLGVATLRQPPSPAPKTLVYVEMALKVRFAPDDGLLSVMAVLTANSYLFDTRCKLTGGFAFCIWFQPTNPKFDNHAGDFVVTLGGYHPKFVIPPHYPKVPRVGFNWQLSDYGVTIKGEAYFALTPSYIMAGARLSAVFRAGGFCAWFEAHADFLIGWAPLHYEAEVGVRIGAAVSFQIFDITCTLSFEIGALLTIWGPPFAGEAYVDLGIVAFTVPLGDRNVSRTAEKLGWKQFAAQFLPPDALGVSIKTGLIEDQKGKDYVIVNPSELCLGVESFIPITESTDVGTKLPGPLGVRPMGEQKFRSVLRLTCEFGTKVDAGKVVDGTEIPMTGLTRRPTLKNVPDALWSPELMPDARKLPRLPGAKPIENVLMGVEVLPKPGDVPIIKFELSIKDTPVPLAKRPSRHWDHAPYKEPTERLNDFRKAWRHPDEQIIEAMRKNGFDIPPDAVELEETDKVWNQTADSTGIWLAPPLLVQMGKLWPLPHAG